MALQQNSFDLGFGQGLDRRNLFSCRRHFAPSSCYGPLTKNSRRHPLVESKYVVAATLGRPKLANFLRTVFEMKYPTARGPLVLNPSKDPSLIRIVDDCAIAVGFTQRTEWMWEDCSFGLKSRFTAMYG